MPSHARYTGGTNDNGQPLAARAVYVLQETLSSAAAPSPR